MGKEISGAGDSPVKIHLVEAGSVGIYRLTGDGQRVLEGIRGPGEMLGPGRGLLSRFRGQQHLGGKQCVPCFYIQG